MSDTPRTDAETYMGSYGYQKTVNADFARQLERELNQRTAEIEMLRGVGCGENGDGTCGVCIKCYSRDARRYRAIRSILTDHMIRTLTDWVNDPLAPCSELDEAVDHAIATQKTSL